jgi:hypothetical protein
MNGRFEPADVVNQGTNGMAVAGCRGATTRSASQEFTDNGAAGNLRGACRSLVCRNRWLDETNQSLPSGYSFSSTGVP